MGAGANGWTKADVAAGAKGGAVTAGVLTFTLCLAQSGMSADDFDADIAERYGWVNRTLDNDDLDPALTTQVAYPLTSATKISGSEHGDMLRQ